MSTQILTLQDIPRVTPGFSAKRDLRELDDLGKERMLLAQRAKDVLGYGGLVAEVTGDVSSAVKEGKLTAGLRSIGIEVLDIGRVIDYQMQEMVRMTREKILSDLDDWTHGYFTEAGWSKTALESYTQPIPEFVLDKALRIKEVVPNVKFHIQHMREPKADPFLIAHLDSEIYYIEAWDEPRFEGRVGR